MSYLYVSHISDSNKDASKLPWPYPESDAVPIHCTQTKGTHASCGMLFYEKNSFFFGILKHLREKDKHTVVNVLLLILLHVFLNVLILSFRWTVTDITKRINVINVNTSYCMLCMHLYILTHVSYAIQVLKLNESYNRDTCCILNTLNRCAVVVY